MRVVLAGYGFLGARVAEVFLTAGWEVSVIRRQPSRVNGIKFVQADLMVQAPVLDSVSFDAAVFCLSPGGRNTELYRQTYVVAQQNFLAGLQASRYLYISSTAVYADDPGTYSEISGSAETDKALILLEAERVALSRQGCVLRLAGLYSRERRIYDRPGVAYKEDRLVHFIHRDDAARAAFHAVDNHLTGIYNVHDGNPQWRSRILHDQSLARTGARNISCEKFFRTGFQPRYPDYFAGLAD